MSSSSALPACQRTPTTGILFEDCCACAASGQAAAEPAIPFMRSRRRTASPTPPDCIDLRCDYSRNLRPAKWDLGVSLHSSNPEPLMSALGQKQTSQHILLMSALRLKADIGHQPRDVR